MTKSDQIWNDIKDKNVVMFSLPSQKVEALCKRVDIDPERCFLSYSIPSFVIALEQALSKDNKYKLEQINKYIVISVI